MKSAKDLFEGTGITVIADGDRYLWCCQGFRLNSMKISEFVGEVKILSAFALTQPHAAYSALCHGLIGKWTYLARTIPHSSDSSYMYLLRMPYELFFYLPSLVKAHSMTLNETCWHFQLGWGGPWYN